MILACCLVGCQTPNQVAPVQSAGVVLRPPSLDSEFRRIWDDGAAEVSTYTTERLRSGSLRKGTATAVLRRATFSVDDRVAEPDDAQTSTQQRDVFPVMQMNWLERYAIGAESCDETTTSVISLSSVDGRAAGSENKTDFSAQSWDGQLFHQLLFDATGVRSHQYSFQKEGDEQITLSYPRDGVSADALWFWARRMGAPSVDEGQERTVDLLPRLRDARQQHQSLSWKKVKLAREGTQKGEQFTVRGEDGRSETFLVEKAAPFRVLHWENSDGEHVDFVNSSRLKSWEPPPTVSRK